MSDGRGHDKVSVAVRPAAGADAAVEHGMDNRTRLSLDRLTRLRDVVEILNNVHNDRIEVESIAFNLLHHTQIIVLVDKNDNKPLITLDISNTDLLSVHAWHTSWVSMTDYLAQLGWRSAPDIVEEWREKIDQALKSK